MRGVEITKMRLGAIAAALAFALAATVVGAAAAAASSRSPLLELKFEGKPLTASTEVLLVAGYSLGGCYWEEQELKVTVNRASADKLVRSGQAGQAEGCDGGAKSVEITSAGKMTVRLAPLRIHLEGGCVYEFKQLSAAFSRREWGPEIYGSAAGKLDKAESAHASSTCAKTRTTLFDVALSGVETRLTG
jgi:hypothetical protein